MFNMIASSEKENARPISVAQIDQESGMNVRTTSIVNHESFILLCVEVKT